MFSVVAFQGPAAAVSSKAAAAPAPAAGSGCSGSCPCAAAARARAQARGPNLRRVSQLFCGFSSADRAATVSERRHQQRAKEAGEVILGGHSLQDQGEALAKMLAAKHLQPAVAVAGAITAGVDLASFENIPPAHVAESAKLGISLRMGMEATSSARDAGTLGFRSHLLTVIALGNDLQRNPLPPAPAPAPAPAPDPAPALLAPDLTGPPNPPRAPLQPPIPVPDGARRFRSDWVTDLTGAPDPHRDPLRAEGGAWLVLGLNGSLSSAAAALGGPAADPPGGSAGPGLGARARWKPSMSLGCRRSMGVSNETWREAEERAKELRRGMGLGASSRADLREAFKFQPRPRLYGRKRWVVSGTMAADVEAFNSTRLVECHWRRLRKGPDSVRLKESVPVLILNATKASHFRDFLAAHPQYRHEICYNSFWRLLMPWNVRVDLKEHQCVCPRCHLAKFRHLPDLGRFGAEIARKVSSLAAPQLGPDGLAPQPSLQQPSLQRCDCSAGSPFCYWGGANAPMAMLPTSMAEFREIAFCPRQELPADASPDDPRSLRPGCMLGTCKDCPAAKAAAKPCTALKSAAGSVRCGFSVFGRTPSPDAGNDMPSTSGRYGVMQRDMAAREMHRATLKELLEYLKHDAKKGWQNYAQKEQRKFMNVELKEGEVSIFLVIDFGNSYRSKVSGAACLRCCAVCPPRRASLLSLPHFPDRLALRRPRTGRRPRPGGGTRAAASTCSRSSSSTCRARRACGRSTLSSPTTSPRPFPSCGTPWSR